MRPARLRNSFVSSIFSRVFTAALQFLCAPKFLHFLGDEAYGIIGIFLTLSAVSNVLDFGFSQSINREIARRLNEPEHIAEVPSVLKSFETIYWLISMGVTLVLIAAAPVIAGHVLHASTPTSQLTVSLVLVALAVGAQFPFTFYLGALFGFERQVAANTITAAFAVPRIGGALVVAMATRDLDDFLWWQIAVSLLQTLTYGWFVWRASGSHRREGVFDVAHFVKIRGFLTGAGVASLLASLLMYSDKLVVPAVLPLALVGLYSLGTSPVVAVSMVNTAVSTTFFPRFARMVAAGDEDGIAKLYHNSSLVTSTALSAVTLTLMFFAHPFLFAWQGHLSFADQTSLPLQLMCLAVLFNGLMTLPYAVQLAYGWTGLGVSIAAGALVCLPPAMYVLAGRYGLVGAPVAWLVGNVVMFGFQASFMFRRILKGHGTTWFLRDTMLPIGLMALIAWGLRAAIPESPNRWVTLAELCAVGAVLSSIGLVLWAIRRGRFPLPTRARG